MKVSIAGFRGTLRTRNEGRNLKLSHALLIISVILSIPIQQGSLL